MKSTTKVWIVTVVSLLGVVGLLGGVKAGQIGAMIAAGKSFSPPPESITSARVETVEWQAQREAVATLVAVRGVTLSAELPGAVRAIEFQSGSTVRRGAVLVRLDTAMEEALLSSARAEATLARLSLDRAVSLREGGANTPADLDAARARMAQAEGAVASLEATIAKKTIRAPFDGRISISQVEVGQVLAPGTPIASLQSVDPIHADFWLPQQALAEVKVGQKAHLHTDTFKGATWEGAVTTVNTEVDPATRNVRMRATFPNPDGRLRPGMFARAEVLQDQPQPTLVIPATAVLFAPYGDSVFVVGEEKAEGGATGLVARQSFVRLGERRGDLVAVVSGLEAGQTVVSSGGFKLRNGQAVVVNNELAPDAKADAAPADR
jgi:membrane fusion protein (multidrug efflux system)